MKVDLRELKPNPMRDFAVDPIDEERVAVLSTSIKEDGFWGGVVGRKLSNGEIQIAAGHTRVEAAKRAGVTIADIFVVADMDDRNMIRVYARENATQRGDQGVAQVGSVASALRFISKEVLGGPSQEFLRRYDLNSVLGNIANGRGLGQNVIEEFLDGVPGINHSTVQQALANLKSSGHYARIIGGVQDEIQRENEDALKALERAERAKEEAKKKEEEAKERRKEAEAKAKDKAEKDRAVKEHKEAKECRKEADKEVKKFDGLKKGRDAAKGAIASANGKPIEFDYDGVTKHLKKAHHIDVFREQVTSVGIAPFLAVNKQADLAEHLVNLAKVPDAKGRVKELTGAFIREHISHLVLNVKDEARSLTKYEESKILKHDRVKRAKQYQRDFARACNSQGGYALKLKELWEAWPAGELFPVTSQFREAIANAKKVIDILYGKL